MDESDWISNNYLGDGLDLVRTLAGRSTVIPARAVVAEAAAVT